MKVSNVISYLITAQEALCPDKSRFLGLLAPLFLLVCNFSCSNTPERPGEDPRGLSIETALEAYYTGHIEEAVRELELLLETHEDDVFIKRQLAVLYREMGERRQDVKVLEELTEGDSEASGGPYQNDAWFELFAAYYLSGNTKKAAAVRDKAFASVFEPDHEDGERERADFLFFDAMIKKEEGESDQAVKLFRESLALNRYRPIAWFSLGELLEKTAPREAETCYRNAITQDGAFSQALYPLGRLLAARKAWPQARDILDRAARRYPGSKEIAEASAEARRRSGGTGGAILLRRRIGANPPKVSPAPQIPGTGSAIRIGLAERRELVPVKTGGTFTISAEDSGAVYRGKAREQVWISWKAPASAVSGGMVLEDGGGKVLLRSSSRFFLKYAEASGTSIIAGIVAGAPGINRSYRGELEFIFTPEGITVVNILNIEDYLYSVVPSEMPASWPEEALKAQAIAARSYAAAQIGQFADKGFDLYGTPRSMAYQGIGAENKTTSKAVDATRGMILRGGEEPLRAYFSANHGGYSEDSLVMWGYDAWMAGVPDVMLDERSRGIPPGELDHWLRSAPPSYSSVRGYHFASSYRWEKWVAADEIRYRLSLRGEDPGTIERIVSRGRGVSGRIYALEAEGKEKSVTVAGDAIWYAMGALRSSLFTIAYKYDKTGNVEYVIFRGAGHGHGIGLDQHGAAGMAGSGYSVEEILRHYYPRAEISRW